MLINLNKVLLFFVIIVITLSGCTVLMGGGDKISHITANDTNQIIIGKSTMNDIRAKFGEPTNIEQKMNNSQYVITWVYGGRWYGFNGRQNIHQLHIIFNNSNIVTNMNYYEVNDGNTISIMRP